MRMKGRSHREYDEVQASDSYLHRKDISGLAHTFPSFLTAQIHIEMKNSLMRVTIYWLVYI